MNIHMVNHMQSLDEFGIIQEDSGKHGLHYLVLVLGLLVSAFFFVYFKHNSTGQVLSAALGSVYYTFWGISHHLLENRLTKLIALEYILVGVFVFFLLFATISLQG